MKRIIAILLSFAPLFAFAQEHQIIGGYLLDGEDSFEELDAAVVTDAKRRDRNLDGKGMRFPVYVKSSYSRENSDSPLTKWSNVSKRDICICGNGNGRSRRI